MVKCSCYKRQKYMFYKGFVITSILLSFLLSYFMTAEHFLYNFLFSICLSLLLINLLYRQSFGLRYIYSGKHGYNNGKKILKLGEGRLNQTKYLKTKVVKEAKMAYNFLFGKMEVFTPTL